MKAKWQIVKFKKWARKNEVKRPKNWNKKMRGKWSGKCGQRAQIFQCTIPPGAIKKIHARPPCVPSTNSMLENSAKMEWERRRRLVPKMAFWIHSPLLEEAIFQIGGHATKNNPTILFNSYLFIREYLHSKLISVSRTFLSLTNKVLLNKNKQ